MNPKPIFDTVRVLLGRGFSQDEVHALDAAIEQALAVLPNSVAPASPPEAGTASRTVGAGGLKLIQKWEGCAKRRADGRFEAYPDPGSKDGHPWTIGWGSTGSDIRPGVVWNQEQCDERFLQELQRYVDEVARTIGDAPTSQNQFDALVSFHYNTGKIATATLTRKHKGGDFAGARAEFGKWIFNDGKPMQGLRNRRADEARLYASPD
ncbi:lysozyme [Altericroceibacterium xinjiangense]|uniref:lysozyme n=1 Tax=Altericroceibacterium xinjiangense TaxID=762261 RepID=UPI000F7F29AF|nr:lysozyme [Altericroceibacterium xinjiangense]